MSRLGNSLSDQTAKRMVRSVLWTEAQARGGPPHQRPAPAHVRESPGVVRVTSTTATSGLYPAVVEIGSGGAFTDAAAACWAFDLAGGKPQVRRYLARRVWKNPADGLPVYAIQQGTFSTTILAVGVAVAGDVYFDTATGILYVYNGTTWIAVSGSRVGRSAQCGTSPVTRYYPACYRYAANPSATFTTPTTGILYALPLDDWAGRTIDQLAFKVTSAGSSGNKSRMALYTSTSVTNLYPDARIATSDSGDIATDTTGLKTYTLGTPYLVTQDVTWIVWETDSAVGSLQLAGLNQGSQEAVLGLDNAFDTPIVGVGWQATLAYAAPPATFTAGGSVWGGAGGSVIPILAVHFSA